MEDLIPLFSQLLSAFIILANVFIILGILFNRKLHGTINWFFLSLLIADLLAGGALPQVSKMSFGKPPSNYWCFAHYAIPNFLFLSFLANLLVMHYAKYTCINHPLHYHQSWVYHRAGLYICLAWVSPLSFASMPLAWYQWKPNETSCSVEQILSWPYLYVETYVFIIPIIFAIAAMGIQMLCIARKQLKNIKKLLNSVNKSQTPSDLEQQLELRHAKSIASVSLIFLVCWVPYIVCLNISLHLEIKKNTTLGTVICIGTASAAAIPIILSLSNRQYTEFWSDMAMKAYRACCRRQGCKQKQNNQPRGNNTKPPMNPVILASGKSSNPSSSHSTAQMLRSSPFGLE